MSARMARNGWYIVTVLMVCSTLSYMDRQILSLLIEPMKRDLALSDTAIGLLGGFAFALFYSVLGLPMGWLVDRVSRRNVIAIALISWSVMTSACGLARDFWGLFFARMGVSIGEATLSPATNSLLPDLFPPQRLASAFSVYTMGVCFGGGLAFIIGGLVVQTVGQVPTLDIPLLGPISSWRAAFVWVGLPGLLIAALLFTFSEPTRTDALATQAGPLRRIGIATTLAEMRKRARPITGLTLATTFNVMYVYAVFFWLPTFFQRVHGSSPAESGTVVGSALLVGGCAGLFAGGYLSDRGLRKGIPDIGMRVGMMANVFALVFFSVALLVPGHHVLCAALCWPAIAAAMMGAGPTAAALQGVLPSEIRGQASALSATVAGTLAMTFGPLLPGLINDRWFGDERFLGESLAITIALGAIGSGLAFAWTASAYRAKGLLQTNT